MRKRRRSGILWVGYDEMMMMTKEGNNLFVTFTLIHFSPTRAPGDAYLTLAQQQPPPAVQ